MPISGVYLLRTPSSDDALAKWGSARFANAAQLEPAALLQRSKKLAQKMVVDAWAMYSRVVIAELAASSWWRRT